MESSLTVKYSEDPRPHAARTGKTVTRWSALSTLSALLRKQVFASELQIPEEFEFDTHESEATTRHVLGLIGDSPCAYARWRLTMIDGNHVALLDRLCVVQQHRRKGVARAAMQHILIDITAQAQHMSVPLAGLVVNVPVDPSFAFTREKLAATRFTLRMVSERDSYLAMFLRRSSILIRTNF